MTDLIGFEDPAPDSPKILPPSLGTATSSSAMLPDALAAPSTPASTQAAPAEQQPTASPPAKSAAQDGLLVGFNVPQSQPMPPFGVQIPALRAPDVPLPGDLIEIDASALGKSEFLKDAGARLRESKPSDKVLKQEETAEQAWRRLLSGLATTDFVHVRLFRRRIDGSYLPMGSRYHMSADEAREIDKLIPWAGKWVIAIARADNRADNEAAYRKFTYERGGAEMPEGWSFDGELDWDQELDMSTARELVEAIFAKQQAAAAGPAQQTVTPGFPGPGGTTWPGYYPGYGAPAWGTPAWGGLSPQMEEDRRRREDDERRRRDDEIKRQANEATARREERDRLEVERKAADERHRAEMEALRKMVDDSRLQAEKSAREAAERHAADQQHWRDERDRLEREKADAAHRAELGGVSTVVEALRKEISDLKAGVGGPLGRGGTDWAALTNSIVPLITGYLTSERESRSDERRSRLEDVSRERDRASRDAEQMTKLVTMLGESQINSAKVAGDLIQRMQDPSALMNLTRLVSETLGGNVQLVATLVKSGLTGGNQGPGIDWGGLIGQGLETLGGIATSFADLKQEQLRSGGSVSLMPPAPAPFAAAPQPRPVPQPRPAAVPRPVPAAPAPATAPRGPAPAAAAPAQPGTALLRGMVDTFKEAVAHEHDPKEVAGMIDAIVYSAQKYHIDQADPKSAAFIQAIRSNPEQTLRAAFPSARPEYLHQIAQALINSDDEDGDGDEATAAHPGNGGQPPAGPQAVPPAPPAAGPVVAMPSKRGRGRPRKVEPVLAAAPPSPASIPVPVPALAPPAKSAAPPPPKAPATSWPFT